MKTLLEEKEVSLGTEVMAINRGKAHGKPDYYKPGDRAILTHWFEDGTFGASSLSSNILDKKDFVIYSNFLTYEIY